MDKFNLLIPSAFGVEAVVKRQMFKLGYEDTRAINGRIETTGDWYDIARLNTFLRSGERVLIKLFEFDATTFDELYENIKSFEWENWLSKDSRILTYAKSIKSTLFAIKSICSITKKGIVDRLKTKFHCELTEKGARSMIEVSIFEDRAVVTLDTSGDGLHKRGYRSLSVQAPLKETLASALCDLTVYNPDKQFVDLFCGSGTIPIELALKELNIAVGLNRDFDFLHWKNVDLKTIELARQEAKDKERRDKKLSISGFDINKEAISVARYHAKQAGVDDVIHFQVADMKDFSSKQRYGVCISNPPYGERLNSYEEVEQLYKTLGEVYKKLPDWNFYIFTGYADFEKCFGKKANKNRKFYNANLECYLYSFLSAKPPKNDR